MEKEIWKKISDILGYEEWTDYEISSFGRVKSYTRYSKGKILKTQIHKSGYVSIAFNINKKRCRKNIHRLVALAFIYNHENKPEVNHINGIKTDNKVNNLEWVTAKENIRHSFNVLNKELMKPVICIETNEIYNSLNDCAKNLNLNVGSISNVCNNKIKSTGGHTFKFIN